MLNKISSGESVNYLIPTDAPTLDSSTKMVVKSGSPVLVGNLFGIASTSGEAGDLINLHLTGIFELPKPNNVAITFGQKLYFDPTTRGLTPVVGANWVATASEAAAPADLTVVARLNGIPVDSTPPAKT